MSRTDARIREMQFLARLDRGELEFVAPPERVEDQQMIMSFIADGYCNDGLDALERLTRLMPHQITDTQESERSRSMLKVIRRVPLTLKITHKGRVRLSELQQQLRTGRGRDPTELCVAMRHMETELAIALLSASNETPLSVAYLDMNGLKAINDKHRHAGGNRAIKAYLEAVIATFGERGEAYRGEGSDEVVVILPNVDDAAAAKLLDNFARQLAKDPLVLDGEELILTASCGSACTTDPNLDAKTIGDLADKAQYRAKYESKKHDPRVSAIAVGAGDVKIFNPHTRDV
ncbi:diguanylate cyclase [Polyangium sp. 15x6]|uniref:GGDEF domain-containing protein n=1 Tax=Polyangium sp. 15x6 TaxID=3042687 RepID=UPI00249BA524|nr:diguanylate cyclase [Polyangium sp. 15x6]MDI3290137.1 diguanylate cyclase [Polyangium sp. 15x6]